MKFRHQIVDKLWAPNTLEGLQERQLSDHYVQLINDLCISMLQFELPVYSFELKYEVA